MHRHPLTCAPCAAPLLLPGPPLLPCLPPDAEWYAVISFLRELPVSINHGFSDCFWDARSMFSGSSCSAGSECGDGEALSPRSAAAAARQAARERIPRSLVPKGAAAPWVPNPPLQFAGEGWEGGGWQPQQAAGSVSSAAAGCVCVAGAG